MYFKAYIGVLQYASPWADLHVQRTPHTWISFHHQNEQGQELDVENQQIKDGSPSLIRLQYQEGLIQLGVHQLQ